MPDIDLTPRGPRRRRRTRIERDVLTIRILLALILILAGLWISGAFSHSETRTVRVQFHGYVNE